MMEMQTTNVDQQSPVMTAPVPLQAEETAASADTQQTSAAAVMRPQSSVSSIGTVTKRSNNVFISKYTVDTFFSHKAGIFESAISDCEKNNLKPEEGKLLGSWLLTEIDQWDCELEKLVLLTENALVVVRYDWVKKQVYSSKSMNLKDVKFIKIGDLVYPQWSLMPARDHGGVRVCTDDESNSGFFSKWNFAGAASMPYWTFAHHRLLYAEGEQETATYNVDEFQESLKQRLMEIHRGSDGGESQGELPFKVMECPLLVECYGSLTAAVYNQSSLGFSKDRHGVNY